MNKKVTIYTTPACVYCRAAKDFFQNHKVVYEEHNVGLDTARREEMVKKSGQLGVPVIAIESEEGDEQIIVGFDQVALKNALGG